MNKLPEETGGIVPRRPGSLHPSAVSSMRGRRPESRRCPRTRLPGLTGRVRPRVPDNCSRSEKVQDAFEGFRLQSVAKTDGF